MRTAIRSIRRTVVRPLARPVRRLTDAVCRRIAGTNLAIMDVPA